MQVTVVFQIKVLFYKLVAFSLKLVTRLIPQPMPMIYCGPGSTRQLAEHIARGGQRSVLLVTDKIIQQLGVADPLCEVLKDCGMKVEIFADVSPEPDDTVVLQGIERLQLLNCDAVVGFGGGSVLDAAKLIAIAGKSSQSLHSMKGILKIKTYGLPLFLVPTTAGTGSEVTMAAVLTDSKTGKKQTLVDPKLLPLAIALDAETMLAMPPHVTATTGIDALTHGVEAYISRNSNAETDRYAVQAVQLIFQFLPEAYKDGSKLHVRQAMALASCYAGLAFTKAGLGYVHGISHQLGAQYHVPHGLANAYALPHVLRFSEPAARQRFRQLAITIGIAEDNKTDAQLSLEFVEAVEELKQTLNLPRQLDSLIAEDIPALAKAALHESHYLYAVPCYMTHKQCVEIMAKLLPARAG